MMIIRGFSILLFGLSIATSAVGQAGGDTPESPDAPGSTAATWTPDLAMRFRSIGGTTFSPDNRWVAFTIRSPRMEGEQSDYQRHIHLAAVDGSEVRQFTRGESSSWSPSFSPDGSHMTFLSDRSEKTQIWIIPVDGGEAAELSSAENGVRSYAWSRDGARIAFTMTQPDSKEEKKSKDEKRHIIRVDQNFKYSHLYIIDIDGFEADSSKQITSGDITVGSFDWSPDNRHIVFDHAINTNINQSMLDKDISIAPADSGALIPLVVQPGVDANPVFSHDGTRVVFSSQGGSTAVIGLNDFYTVDIVGGAVRALPNTPNRSSSLVGWSSDDDEILISEPYRTTSQLFTIPTSGTGEVTRFTDRSGTIGELAMSLDGSMIVFVIESTDVPGDLFVSSLNAFEPRKITDIHAEIEIPLMGRTEVISWTSPDGLEIEGLLTYPVGYTESTRVPLVLQIHGGPSGVFTQSFTGDPSTYQTQVFAQNGYAILRPNPRGSTGYGKDFRYANFMDWGFGDWDDVESGVDIVISMGIAHPDSLLLMGWSYGGYMTSFGVTRTNRFRAASMGAGLPNLISMVTTTDIQDYLVGHMGGEYWNNYETYERHSAIYRIKNVRTPTQIIHGENDLRVPTDQGREFYISLKRLGIDTEMIILPRTPHGPREPKLLMAVTPMIMEWFEKHLDRQKNPTKPDGTY